MDIGCIFKGTCCEGSQDVFWLDDFTKLFCSLTPIPQGKLSSPERLNAVTRLTLYIFLIMLSSNYKYKLHFLLMSLIFIVLLYKISKDSKMSENYAFLSSVNNNNSQMNYKTIPQNLKARHSSLVLTNQPELASYTDYKENRLQSFIDKDGNLLPDNVIKERLEYQSVEKALPLYSRNSSNSYRGGSELAVKANSYNFEAGKRDSQAGIQYYSINQGVNRRTMIDPIIVPRPYDLEYWGKSSTNLDPINRRNYTDITEDELFRQGGPAGQLGVEVHNIPRVRGAVEPMNSVHDETGDGYYQSNQFYYGSETKRDFDHNIMPLYRPDTDANGVIQPIYAPGNVERIERDNLSENYLFNKKNNFNNIHNIDKEEMLGKINEQQYEDLTVKETTNVPADVLLMKKDPRYENWYKKNSIPVRPSGTREGFDFMPLDADNKVAQTFGNLGKTAPVSQSYNMLSRVPDGTVLPKISPVKDQMLNASPTYVYNDKFFSDPSKRMFLQDVQPKIYSWSVEQTPINSNVGISYDPQIPPKVLDQVYSGKHNYPLYTSIDPQLIRTDGTPGQQSVSPQRTNWSAEYSSWQPPEGSINFEDIYDPRFTSYGDPYRSYSDINLGQVSYYYSDVDAYRMPNFVSRSNVDFMEYRTPQNQVWPEYDRTASADDVKPFVENQFMADSTYHREDLMERQMAKRNRETWQLRYAPLSRAAHGHMPFGPT